jgi:hypothetical protein
LADGSRTIELRWDDDAPSGVDVPELAILVDDEEPAGRVHLAY